MQVFIGRGPTIKSEDEFERKLYILRKVISDADLPQARAAAVELLRRVAVVPHADLQGHVPRRPARQVLSRPARAAISRPRSRSCTSASRPTRSRPGRSRIPTAWSRTTARSTRCAATSTGWRRGRRRSSSKLFGDDITKLWPISYEGQSDTACFDNALEFLVQGGYSLAHAAMMLIPEAWAGNPLMDEERRAFYEYHAALMEPWDGPAAIAFTDGRQIGATLDRNGLRPARWLVTDDDRVIMASEAGVLPIPEERDRAEVAPAAGQDAARRSRRGPHHLRRGDQGAARQAAPLREVAEEARSSCWRTCRRCSRASRAPNISLLDRQQCFGYTQEDLQILMAPMATTGQEAVGSMGTDTPISALSDKSKLLYTYFKQNFAQVTNPPIDPIREELVMSLVSFIGPRPNLFDLEGHREEEAARGAPADPHQRGPGEDPLDRACRGAVRHQDARHHLSGRAGRGRHEGRARRRSASAPRPPCSGGYNIIILSDRMRRPRPHSDPGAARDRRRAPSPDPQGPAHLGRPRGRDRRGARGASFLLPRRLRRGGDQSLSRLRDARRHEGRDAGEARRQGDRQALHQVDRQGHPQGDVQDGHLDLPVLLRRADFRRGRPASAISSANSSSAPRRASRASGSPRSPRRPRAAIAMRSATCRCSSTRSTSAANMLFRVRGEAHAWTPETVATLQHAVRGNSRDKYRAFAKMLNEQAEQLLTIRGLFRIKTAEEDGRKPVPLEEVEPAKEIVRRFATGAMSLRLDLARGAHHARHRDEPHRRQVEHRRGRRGSRPLQAAAERRLDALGDQAGRLGPLRRHHRISRQLRHDADQDGAGRKARRRRAVARPQGRRDHRQGAPLDAGRRPDLAAAASRHLFDRGPGAAHLRPEEHQPGRRRLGEARLRSRRRHGRGRRLEGARRPCDDLGLRGRHRRVAPDLDQACRLAVGDRARRNPPDAGAEPPAQPHRRAGRRRHCAPAATS